MPEVNPDSWLIFHTAVLSVGVVKMKRFPTEFFQTGMYGARKALSSESTYNPASEFEVELSPVTWMASQISERKKIHGK